MEFNEKLQELRKRRGLTQEELAGAIFVSRTAVSKWESGRGYPSIDSLKVLAKFFSVTIDELLSGDEILSIAEEDGKQREQRIRRLVCALLDLSAILFFFLPLFGERAGESIRAVSLLSLNTAAAYLKAAYFTAVTAMIVSGILNLSDRRPKSGERISLAVNAIAALLFIISSQPYAAALLFVFLLIKLLTPLKKR